MLSAEKASYAYARKGLSRTKAVDSKAEVRTNSRSNMLAAVRSLGASGGSAIIQHFITGNYRLALKHWQERDCESCL